MVNPQHSSKPGGSAVPPGRQGIKTLVGTASLAAILGGWALLSAERAPVTQNTLAATVVAPRIVASANVALGLPPLPTLVPPSAGMAPLPTPEIVVSQPAAEPTLRAVDAPPPQRVVHVGGGGGGASAQGQGPAPVAQTRSSK